MVETINKVIRVSRQLLQELGHDPSPEEIAEALCAGTAPSSLSYYNEDGEIKEIEIGISQSAEDTVSDKLAVEQLMEKLTDEERKLITLRYFGGKTQSETARLMSMSQVQVSRKEKKILKAMYKFF